jgi:hypothetical protein
MKDEPEQDPKPEERAKAHFPPQSARGVENALFHDRPHTAKAHRQTPSGDS